MLRITIELAPYGDDEHTEVIGAGVIGRVDLSSDGVGEYVCELVDDFGARLWSQVLHMPERGLWALVGKAVAAAVADEAVVLSEQHRQQLSHALSRHVTFVSRATSAHEGQEDRRPPTQDREGAAPPD